LDCHIYAARAINPTTNQVLGDASRRAQYDKFGTAASHPDEDPFDPAQVFRDFEQSFARESEGVSARPAGHGANVTVRALLLLGIEGDWVFR
jgi:DnaJ-class molecular chaperone